MTIKELLTETAFLVEDADFIEAIDDEDMDEEQTSKYLLLKKSYDKIAEEIGVRYCPLKEYYTMHGGKIEYDEFDVTPIRVVSVRNEDGKQEEFKTYPTFIETVDKEVTVEVEYYPETLDDDEDFPFENTYVGKRGFEYGIASEYCLARGRYDEAVNWQRKYEDTLSFNRKDKNFKIKARRTWGV